MNSVASPSIPAWIAFNADSRGLQLGRQVRTGVQRRRGFGGDLLRPRQHLIGRRRSRRASLPRSRRRRRTSTPAPSPRWNAAGVSRMPHDLDRRDGDRHADRHLDGLAPRVRRADAVVAAEQQERAHRDRGPRRRHDRPASGNVRQRTDSSKPPASIAERRLRIPRLEDREVEAAAENTR